MALTKFTADVNIIASLSNLPNADDGLTPSSLKEKFDKVGSDLKDYINNTLTTQIDTQLGGKTVCKTGTLTFPSGELTYTFSDTSNALGLKSTSIVYCQPAVDGVSEHYWNLHQIYCSNVGTKSITFTAATVPISALDILVLVLN